jgi:hypothetical protein
MTRFANRVGAIGAAALVLWTFNKSASPAPCTGLDQTCQAVAAASLDNMPEVCARSKGLLFSVQGGVSPGTQCSGRLTDLRQRIAQIGGSPKAPSAPPGSEPKRAEPPRPSRALSRLRDRSPSMFPPTMGMTTPTVALRSGIARRNSVAAVTDLLRRLDERNRQCGIWTSET